MEIEFAAASGAIAQNGCAFVSGSIFMAHEVVGEYFPQFAASWHDLPADPYIVDTEPYRYRRHARALFDPPSRKLDILPEGEYFQSSTINPIFGGIARRFPAVHWDAASTGLCTALIETSCIRLLRLDRPTTVNIHQVRIVGDENRAGEPAPEGPHRDGFAFISVHLVDRDLDRGGATSVLEENGHVRAADTLSAPLDAVYVNDRELLHYTSPIDAQQRRAYRDVLLLSYEPAG